jgi:hypothetical protein
MYLGHFPIATRRNPVRRHAGRRRLAGRRAGGSQCPAESVVGSRDWDEWGVVLEICVSIHYFYASSPEF